MERILAWPFAIYNPTNIWKQLLNLVIIMDAKSPGGQISQFPVTSLQVHAEVLLTALPACFLTKFFFKNWVCPVVFLD